MRDRDGQCDECGFDWSSPLAVAVEKVAEAPARYELPFRSEHGPTSRGDQVWTPRDYLWHMVDVLRYGTERLWTLELDPGAGVLAWDENLVATVRDGSPLSALVGLQALSAAVGEGVRAVENAPGDVTAVHPEFGPMDRLLMVRRMPTRRSITSSTSDED
jgi:hypothetical protein